LGGIGAVVGVDIAQRWITEVAHLGVGPVLPMPMVIAQWRNGVRRSSTYR
jgi:hypothetical protein